MTKRILLQGVTQDSHLTAVRHLLQIPNPEKIIISAAFMNEGGLTVLEEALLPVANQTTIIAGIRNGITSAQALRKCLEVGCTTYVVDTGSRGVLFHPKIYVARNADMARLIVGSANLTVGGLVWNIEASSYTEMELDKADTASLIAELEATFDGMLAEYPEHIFQVTDNGMITSLLDSGRVVDESMRPAPIPSGASRNRDLDTVPRMELKNRPIPRHRVEPFQREGTTPQPSAPVDAAVPSQERPKLVWQSNPLTRRDLSIPRGATTNPTGSMLFGKGPLIDADQRHYFRDEVFATLPWQSDATARASHYERAVARFRLVIRDVDYGVFELHLSHNTRTDTRAYEQGNSMTQLHWGEARNIIAREDLLGRTAYLYRDSVDSGLFVLEID